MTSSSLSALTKSNQPPQRKHNTNNPYLTSCIIMFYNLVVYICVTHHDLFIQNPLYDKNTWCACTEMSPSSGAQWPKFRSMFMRKKTWISGMPTMCLYRKLCYLMCFFITGVDPHSHHGNFRCWDSSKNRIASEGRTCGEEEGWRER